MKTKLNDVVKSRTGSNFLCLRSYLNLCQKQTLKKPVYYSKFILCNKLNIIDVLNLLFKEMRTIFHKENPINASILSF